MEEKRKTPQNCKNSVERQKFITTIKIVKEYTHKHTQNQNSPTKIKYNRLTWQTKEIKKLYLPVKNKTN